MSVQAVQQSQKSYDEVPYESLSHPQTHASYLYTVATLFGLNPPDFRTANVLEIGCAAGGNLFPQAINYPKATYTGIDLSAEQIAHANNDKKALGVDNVTFRQEDIMAFDLKKEKGKYDYIIAHGIFSWVPEQVRDKLLEICREALSPTGIAVVSYNTLPGWNAVRSLREMMLYQTIRFKTAEEKVRQARALLDFLIECVPADMAAYRGVLESERAVFNRVNDSYIFHDHLEGVNAQFYFSDFVGMANAKGLDYVGDAALSMMYVGNMPPKAVAHLQTVGDIVAQEQYMDFVTNRRFRTTLLCKKGQKIDRDLKSSSIMNYMISGNFAMKNDPPSTLVSAGFRVANGMEFTTNDAPSTALFRAIAAAGGQPIPAQELIARAAKEAKISEKLAAEMFLGNGVQLLLKGIISIHSAAPAVADKVSAKPEVWRFARHQAGRTGTVWVTNMLGGAVQTDETANTLIAHMDGTRDVDALVGVLAAALRDGRLKAQKDGQAVSDIDAIRPQLEETVKNLLPRLAAQHLLVK